MAIQLLKFDCPLQDWMKAALWLVLYVQMIQLASLMDSTHQPQTMLLTWKPDQFSQLIRLCDLMTTHWEENGNVNTGKGATHD